MPKKIRLAMFCTNQWPTPPPGDTFYAPLWVAKDIADGIAARGHHVTYFGATGSRLTHAQLETLKMRPQRFHPGLQPYLPRQNDQVLTFYENLMLAEIYRRANAGMFDLIHVHPYRRAIPFVRLTRVPTVVTIHDPIEGFNRWMLEQTRRLPRAHLVSISNAQRRGAPRLRYAGTVYNGIDLARYPFNPRPGNHLVAAGRFVPEKGFDLALRATKLAGWPLRLAGGLARGTYWEQELKPRLDRERRYIGMLPSRHMPRFYGSGLALINPIRWEEPFGLVMIEAMACGTPVVAFDRGSVREVVRDGVTGFVVQTLPEMVRAMKRINTIDRRACRAWVEQKFTVEKMVEGYEKVYQKILPREKRTDSLELFRQ